MKRSPIAKCSACHFQPQEDEDKAKSLILSLAYEIDGEYRGKTKEELQLIAAAIAKGQLYAFDDAEVRSIIEYAERVLAVPAKQLIIDGLRWLLPTLILAVVAYFLLFFNKDKDTDNDRCMSNAKSTMSRDADNGVINCS